MSQGFTVERINFIGGAVGEIIAYAGAGEPDGTLFCDGRSLSTTGLYADLFAVIGYKYGGSGANFNIPDYRGEFLRGMDAGAGTDPDAASRTNRGDGTGGDVVGSKQADDFKSHNHTEVRESTTVNHGVPGGSGIVYMRSPITVNTGDTGGNETRPTNVNVRYCIRYKPSIEDTPAGVTDVFVNGTKQASTSGTEIDFTVPAGVKEFTVMYDEVGSSGTTQYDIELGDAGGIETTGYLSNSMNFNGTAISSHQSSTGSCQVAQPGNASSTVSGHVTFKLLDPATNTWTYNGILSRQITANQIYLSGGRKSLSGELTTVRLTFRNGTDTFDNGNVNIMYDNQELDLGSSVLSGSVVQTVYVQDGEVFTGTTTIPSDDTIPQSTEGNEWKTISITPTSAANKLRIDVCLDVSWSGTNGNVITALFLDSETDARAAKVHTNSGGAGTSGFNQHETFTYWMTAGQATSMTFKVRVGASSAGTVTVNGWNSARKLGGVMASSITITEYAA